MVFDPVFEHLVDEKIRSLEELIDDETIASAESLTSGAIGYALTKLDEETGKDNYIYSELTYATEMKTKHLNVSEDVINTHSVVSKEVAEEMAKGIKAKTNCEYTLSSTGWAGPTGDPVGLVYVGVATPDGVYTEKLMLSGERDEIQKKSALCALDLFIEILKEKKEDKGPKKTQPIDKKVEIEYSIAENLYGDSQYSATLDDPTYKQSVLTAKELYKKGYNISVVDCVSSGSVAFNITAVKYSGSWYTGGRMFSQKEFMKYAEAENLSGQEKYTSAAVKAADKIRRDYESLIGVSISPGEDENTYYTGISTGEFTYVAKHTLDKDDNIVETVLRDIETFVRDYLPEIQCGKYYRSPTAPWYPLLDDSEKGDSLTEKIYI